MKTRSLVTLLVTLLLIVLVGALAVNGLTVGKYIVKPVGSAIKLGLDLRGGIYAVYKGDSSVEDFETLRNATITIMINRLTAQGYTEATVTPQGSDRIRIEIPDVEDPNEILSIVGTPAHLTFEDPDGNVILEGKSIKKASPAYDTENGNAPIIAFELDDEGAKIFGDYTGAHIGEVLSIMLDGKTLTAPKINSAITGGSGIITGFSSIEEAQTTANLILSGALPLDITLIESNVVSPTLGIGALESSLLAGIIGAVYRVPGVVADLALCIYILVVFYALALVPGVQLTLPGIAGILLGIGMAVDGNVIIFERFREELKGGRSIEAACQRGYKNALSSIIDSNVTTIIAAIVLMYFGTGSVKGFAVTLFIGVLASMISSVFITRFLLRQAAGLGIKNTKLWAR